MIPQIKLEDLELSKMICGTNQFIGISHFFHLDIKRWKDPGRIHRSPLSTPYYYFKFRKPEKIAEIMIYLAQEHGINACVSSPRDRIYDAIQITEKETGEKFHWICTPSNTRITAKGLKAEINMQIEWCRDHGVSVCGPHRSFSDSKIDFEKEIIDGLPDVMAKVRDCGMVPLLSTHYHQSISIVEKRDYDVALIIQPLNPIGFESNAESPEELAKKIQDTKIQILNIKPMGAGRVRYDEGLPFCLDRIKPNDFLAVGFGDLKFAKQDAKLVEELLTKK